MNVFNFNCKSINLIFLLLLCCCAIGKTERIKQDISGDLNANVKVNVSLDVNVDSKQNSNTTLSSGEGLLAATSNSTSETKERSSIQANCNLKTIGEVISEFNDRAEDYIKECKLGSDQELETLLQSAKYLGKAEGLVNSGLPVEDKEAEERFANISSTMKHTEPASLLYKKKTGIKKGDIDIIFSLLKEDLYEVGRQLKHPLFFTNKIWDMIMYYRNSEMLNAKFEDKSTCLPINQINILNYLYKYPYFDFRNIEPLTSDTFKLSPNDFEVSGLALAFTFPLDLTANKLISPLSILEGYANNGKKFTYTIQPGKNFDKPNKILNTITFQDQTYTKEIDTDCSEIVYAVLSFERVCDHYKISFALRTLHSGKKGKILIDITDPTDIEQLSLQFLMTKTLSRNIYHNFKYTKNNELTVFLHELEGKSALFEPILSKCIDIPNCDFYSTLNNKCIICDKGTFLTSQGECVQDCPGNSYEDQSSNTCSPCGQNCEKCKSASKCQECAKDSYKFVDKENNMVTCLEKCPLGYKGKLNTKTEPASKECKKCPENCSTCSKSRKKCEECNANYFLTEDTKQCVEKCSEGYYSEFNPRKCNKCPKGCENCLSKDKCTQCSKDYYLKDGGICTKNCGEGYFNDKTLRVCSLCPANCSSCDDSQSCDKCNQGFSLDPATKLCYAQCKKGQTSFKGVCIPCDDSACEKCDPNNVQICLKCDNNLLLEDGDCVDTCCEGNYANEKRECVPCSANCQVCNADKCLLCSEGHYLLNDLECRSDCPDGYIISGKTCLKCQNKLCKKCDHKNTDICTSCYPGEILKEGNCVKGCGSGYFLSKKNKCEKCMDGCLSCSDSLSCDTCDTSLNFYKKDSVCVKDCGKGYRENKEDFTCEKCALNNCASCPNSKTECEKCEKNKVMYSNQCYDKCPVGTYLGSDLVCQDCNKNCEECKSESKCTKCRAPYVLQEKECLTECSDGMFNDNSICRECKDKKCKKCDSSLKDCLDCYEGRFLHKGDCVKKCPNGTYSEGNQCFPCTKPCKECESALKCTDCSKGFVLTPTNTCEDSCPAGSVESPKDKQTCIPCQDEGCDKCKQKDITECIKCSDSYSLLKGDCVTTCPRGHFGLNGICLSCPRGCEVCSSLNECDLCEEGLFLKNKDTCESDCGDGWINLKSTRHCVQCLNNCKKCKEDNTNYCTDCPEGTFLLNGRCLNECPVKHWAKGNKCLVCSIDECVKCSNNGKVCDQCSNGFALNDGVCVSLPCPERKYLSAEGKCEKCELRNCKSCAVEGVNNSNQVCTECVEGFYHIDPYTCESQCPTGYYPDNITKTCHNCPDKCEKCGVEETNHISTTVCTKCELGSFLEDGKCHTRCKEGFRQEIDKCIACDTPGCSRCTQDECISCKSPLVLSSGCCTESCPTGTYLDTRTQSCFPCPVFCDKCSDALTCQKCSEHKFLILTADGKCVDNCPDNTVFIENKCVKCKTNSNCKKCDENNISLCLVCKNGFNLFNNDCVENCPQGYYSENNTCKKCVSNCDVCTDDKTCKECSADHYLLDNTLCHADCPKGFFKFNRKCLPCSSSQCEKCNSEGCLKCAEGFYLEEGECKNSCSAGYFLHNFQDCKKCEKNCIQCLDEDVCQVCVGGFFLKKGDCVENCGDEFTQVDHECRPCDKGCNTCTVNHPEICEECKGEGKYLKNGKCVSNCGAGFYPDKLIGKCLPCLDNCDICSDFSTCNQCISGLTYHPDKNKCVETCGDGYTKIKSECVPCKVEDCKICDSSIDTCDQCEVNKYKLGNEKCVKDCDTKNGYYLDIERSECKLCDYGCKTCRPNGECKTCIEGYVLDDGKCVDNCPLGEVEIADECVECGVKDCEVCSKEDVNTCHKCKGTKVIFHEEKKNEKGKLISTIATCVDSCPDSFFRDDHTCKPCNCPRCKTCTNDKTCEECHPGSLVEKGECKSTCSIGSVERNGKCLECNDRNCAICDNLTLNSCVKCKLPYKLQGDKCVSDCDEGFYLREFDGMHVCRPCNDKCKICSNGNACDQCIDGFFKKDGKCVDSCPENYTANYNRECVKCTQPECTVCSPNDTNKCLICKSPFYLSTQSTCVEDCGDRFYKRSLPTPTCIPCLDTLCLQCSPEDQCLICDKSYPIFKGQCVSKCPTNYFANKDNHCERCYQNECDKCLAEDNTKCESCAVGFFLYNHQCVNKCPAGTFANSLNECQPCSQTCELCVNETSCVKCRAGLVFNDTGDTCTDKCDSGEVEVNGKCQKCGDPLGCIKCDAADLNKCIECHSNKFLHQNECVDQCPLGSFIEGRNCLPCEDNCRNCLDSVTCNECFADYFEYNQDCVKECRRGMINIDGHCKDCADSTRCDKCDHSDLTLCLECREPFKLTTKGKCEQTCETGTYFNSLDKKCEICPDKCDKCENSSTCIKCTPPLLLQDGKCVEDCDSGLYIHPESHTCTPCENQNCCDCDPFKPSNCLTCTDEKPLLLIKSTQDMDCVTTCPDGFYDNLKDSKCEQCDSKCLVCTDKSCIKCLDSFNLMDGECISSCESGYVPRDNVCFKCTDNNCDLCDASNLNRCSKCKSGFILWKENGLCLEKCPSTYYKINDQCVKCPINCDECDEDGCSKCSEGFYFKENAPDCTNCLSPSLISGDRCFDCNVSNCLQCDSANRDNCLQCDSSTIMHEGKCVTSCPNGYYKEGVNCAKCSDNCAECSNLENCTHCKDNFLLFSGTCVNECPPHFSNNGKNVCNSCVQSECEKCDGSLQVCTHCDKLTILFNGKCVKSCPENFFLDTDKCIKCFDKCKSCDKSRCIECEQGYKIKGLSCVKECGEGYFDEGLTCIPCSDTNCVNCSPQNACHQCNSFTYLDKQTAQCITNCPEGFYSDKSSNTCKECEAGCDKCTGEKACFACKPGYSMLDGVCYKDCPMNYTTLRGNCVPCAQKECTECMPENPDKCSKCMTDFPKYQHVCESQCPLSTFNRDNECVNCDPKCLKCTDETTCIECKPEFHIVNAQCQSGCPSGKVDINGMCVSCANDNCDVCSTDVNLCLKCKEPNKLYENTCVTDCPNGFFDNNSGICSRCADGCEKCEEKEKCLSCLPGYFYSEGKCNTSCPKGQFGECSSHLCKHCDTACDECVESTNKDCVRCAEGFYRNEKTCVKPTECRHGTYPNPENMECTICKIPFCESCSDSQTCTQCVRGFTLNSGACEIGKSFVSVFNESKEFDEFTYTNSKDYQIFPISSLNGIGVSSPHVSLVFWLRLLAPVHDSNTMTNLITIKNNSASGYNFSFGINNDTCEVYTSNIAGPVVNTLSTSKFCAYSDLYDWTFFSINLVKNKSGIEISVNTFNTEGKMKEYSSVVPISGPISEIISKDAVILLNENEHRAAFQLSQFIIFDYTPESEELSKLFTQIPDNCDYFCVLCSGQCKRCVDNIPPIDGYCTAQKVTVTNGLKLIDSKEEEMKYNIREKLEKLLVSDRFAFSTWLYIESKVNLNEGVVELYSDNHAATSNTGYIKNNKVEIKKGKLSVNEENPIEEGVLNNDKWYFLSVGFEKDNYRVWLYEMKTVYENKQSSVTYIPLIEKTFTYEASHKHSNTFIRLWSSYQFTFTPKSGSLFNTFIYLNNFPEYSALKPLLEEMTCTQNCAECDKEMRCRECFKGFKLGEEGNCLEVEEDQVLVPRNYIQRLDLWNSESIKIDEKLSDQNDWSMSIWLRKKTHSNLPSDDSRNHRLIGFTQEGSNKIENLIQQNIKEDYISDLVFNPILDSAEKIPVESNTNSTISSTPLIVTRKYASEVYDYTHIGIVFNSKARTLSYNIRNFNNDELKTISFTLQTESTFNINSFIFGDENGEEVNFELTLVNLYNIALTDKSIEKIRATKPIDCDNACKTCNYSNGICELCGSGNRIVVSCPLFLVGYTASYIYSKNNPMYNSIADKTGYNNLLTNNGYTVGVNSKMYSLYGQFSVFDYSNVKDRTNPRYRLFSIGNKGKVFNYPEDPGRDIVIFDLLPRGDTATIEIIISAENQKQVIKLENVTVTPRQWWAVHLGVDVEKKLFRYRLFPVTKPNSVTQGEALFPDFPEKLQQIGGLSILGVNDLLSDEYVIPSARMQSTFFSPNSGFSEDVMTKYLAKFVIQADPKCKTNCSLCLTNSKRLIDCLECSAGFGLINGECVKNPTTINDYTYTVLSERIVTQNSNFILKSQNIFNKEYSIVFYIRRNFYNGDSSRRVLTAGQFGVNVLSSGLTDSIVITTPDNQEAKLELTNANNNNWTLIFITVVNGEVRLRVQSEEKATTTNTLSASIRTTTFDSKGFTLGNFKFDQIYVDTNNNIFQVSGLHLASAVLIAPIVDWPQFDCVFDCDFCTMNKCRSCTYGKTKFGDCVARYVRFQGESITSTNNAITANTAKLSEYLPNSSNYRSNIYTLQFVATINEKTGIIPIIRLNNHDLYSSLEIKYDISASKFFISYNNRFVHNKFNSAQTIEKAYDSLSKKEDHFIGISVNKNKLSYLFYSTNDNYVQGEVELIGEMDHNTINTTFTYFTDKSGKSHESTVKVFKFHYDFSESISNLLKAANKNVNIVQPVCLEGTSHKCFDCSKGVLSKEGFCVVNENTGVFATNKILPISRWSLAGTTFKYPLNTNTIQNINGFTLTFWVRLTSLLSKKQGILRLSLSDGSTKNTSALYSFVYTPKNTLEISFTPNSNSNVIISEFLNADEIYTWNRVSVTVDLVKKEHYIQIYHEDTDRAIERRSKIASVNEVKIPESKNSVVYIQVGFADAELMTTENTNFEITNIVFTPNKVSDSLELTNFNTPLTRKCILPCKVECINGVCPAEQRIKKEINIGNLFLGSEDIQVTPDNSYLDKLPLFRPLNPEVGISNTFCLYLVSFELDVNTFLSSKYVANKDILFVIHNDNKEDYDSLSMNNLVPDLVTSGAISFTHKNGKIMIYTGYVPWMNQFNAIEVPLGGKPIQSYSKIYFSLLVNSLKKTLRLFVQADNVSFSAEIGTLSFPSPISYYSLVYNHPAINKINLNLHSPRFDVDIFDNAKQMENIAPLGTVNTCVNADKNCRKCHVPEYSSDIVCLKCNAGFIFYKSACNPDYVEPSK